MSRKKASSSRPANTEENLPEYDQHELKLQRDLIARAKACAEGAKLAKEEIDKLSKKKDGLNKKDPGSHAMALEIDRKLKVNNGVLKQRCNSRQPACVESVDSKKISSPKSMGIELNKNFGTKIDFEKLSFFEGGEHTVGYIPWWPYLKKDKPKIVFYEKTLAKDVPRLAGGAEAKNKSGVTIGIGVDLGQKSSAEFLKKMVKGNIGQQKISEKELVELHRKIEPYFEKFGGEACKFLRENPLVLNEKESNFLNRVAHEEALRTAIHQYDLTSAKKRGKDFLNLSVEQQTSLFSNGYQKGSPDKELIIAIINQNADEIPKTLRERRYLFDSMRPKKNK